MKVEKQLVLTRAARKAGGDRYETPDGELTIYIPQNISRVIGIPLPQIKITFEDERG